MKKVFFLTLFITILSGFFIAVPSNQVFAAACSGQFDSSSGCYQQLSPITDPGTNQPVSTDDFPKYLQGLYRIGIGACFVLGVIMFTWAGIEYILSESMTKKSDAKARIAAALTGLAIALVSYILLQTINPDLLKFTSLDTTIKK